MTMVQSMLLGAVQGLTEFLPVSSSGHLVLCETLLGVAPSLAFNLGLHLATLLALCVYFRRRIGRLALVCIRWLFRRSEPDDKGDLKVLAHILLATVCTVCLGLALRHRAETPSRLLLGAGLLATGALLLLSRFLRPRVSRELGVPTAIAAGLAQGLAVLPGLSRSGATISALLLGGVSGREAGEFSFILSIPAVLGAALLEAPRLANLGGAMGVPLLVGGGAALGCGLLALRLFMGLVQRNRLWLFAFYVIPLGLLLFPR
jgi:undecaprenyl-diphosphatase